MMENKRPESYLLITDTQKSSLLHLYEEGMHSTLEAEKMRDAVEKTGLSIQRIKVYIAFLFLKLNYSITHIKFLVYCIICCSKVCYVS